MSTPAAAAAITVETRPGGTVVDAKNDFVSNKYENVSLKFLSNTNNVRLLQDPVLSLERLNEKTAS